MSHYLSKLNNRLGGISFASYRSNFELIPLLTQQGQKALLISCSSVHHRQIAAYPSTPTRITLNLVKTNAVHPAAKRFTCICLFNIDTNRNLSIVPLLHIPVLVVVEIDHSRPTQ